MPENMIKRGYIFFVFITIFTVTFGQQNNDNCKCDSMSQSDSESPLKGELLVINESIKGDQFFSDWSKGDVTFINNETIHNKNIRYNGYLDELIWLSTYTLKMIKLEKSSIEMFVLNTPNPSVFKKINLKGGLLKDSTEKFMQVLYEGKLSLYAYRRIKQAETETVRQGSNIYMVDKIEPNYIYYLRLPNKEFISFTNIGKRFLYSILPEQKSNIRKLLRQNHQVVETENDLVEAIKIIEKNLY